MAGYGIERSGVRSLVTLNGDLTASLIPDLQAALKKELDGETSEIVFDLEKTVMLDSSGIGLLIAACNSISRKQGKIQVIKVSSEIRHLLQSMRLISRLNVSAKEE